MRGEGYLNLYTVPLAYLSPFAASYLYLSPSLNPTCHQTYICGLCPHSTLTVRSTPVPRAGALTSYSDAGTEGLELLIPTSFLLPTPDAGTEGLELCGDTERSSCTNAAALLGLRFDELLKV